MFCYVCLAFAHNVIRTMVQIEPAFTKSGHKQVVRNMWGKFFPDIIIKALPFISKQYCNFHLDKAAVVEASILKGQQEGNRLIFYRIIDVVIFLAKASHPLQGDCKGSDSHKFRGLLPDSTDLQSQYDPVLIEHLQNSPRCHLCIQNYSKWINNCFVPKYDID